MRRRKRPAERARAFCIVDPNLKDIVGHYFAYDAAVANGARQAGYQPIVLAHRDVESELAASVGAQPVFSEDIWAGPLPAGRIPRLRARLKANLSFGLTLAARLLKLRLPPHSVVFVHTFIDRQMLGLALLPLLLFWHRSITYVFLLRYQPHFYNSHTGRIALRLMERLAEWWNLRLATDSERLAALYQTQTTLPIEVLPIPHTPAEIRANPVSGRRRGDRCRLVSLGNARDEKGIFEIFAAIRHLHRIGEGGRFEFVVQCNDAAPDVAKAIATMAAENLSECILLHEKLEEEEYQQQLSEADIVLLPYWRSIYQARTSGVFVEALAVGKPVIATRDTWMSDQLEKHGAGLLCEDRDALDLVRAIKDAAANLDELRDRARQRQSQWVTCHNPYTLAAAVAGCPGPAGPRIAMLFPWGDFPDNQSGASRRCNLLADFLAPQIASLRILHGGHGRPLWRGNRLLEALGPDCLVARCVHATLRGAVRVLSSRQGLKHEWILWQYWRMAWNPRFRRRLRRTIRSADVVLLEYPFWARQVMRIAEREGRQVILTAHDLIADQVDEPRLRALAWRLELDAFRRANALITVAPADQAVARAHGLDAALAPNPADSRLFALDEAADLSCAMVPTNGGVCLPPAPFCLFVGSDFEPNRIAARRIRAIAAAMNDSGRSPVNFVVAGGVAPAERADNYIALGKVGDPLLLALYAQADIILVPLPFGTGSSLKTIEGMAAAKPVLGTTAAFRGLATQDNVHVVIDDDLDAWPNRIRALLGDRRLRASLGEAARDYARSYDVGHAFRPYQQMLRLRVVEDEGLRQSPGLDIKQVQLA